MELVAIPLIVVLALILVPLFVRLLDRHAGWPLALVFIAAAVPLLRRLPRIINGNPWTWKVIWIRGFLPNGADVAFSLRADALSTFFALLALGIGAAVFIYSTRYLHTGRGVMSFYLLMTAFMAAIITLVLADDIIILFVSWELVSLASFFLIARSGPGGEVGSVRTIILTFFGGLTLLISMGISAGVTGTTSLSGIIHSPEWSSHPAVLSVVALLIAISACTKSAQFPFHFWLPEAMAADTPVSAFLHAAAVVKAGIYLLLRFSALFHDNAWWRGILIIVGMVTAIMAALFALQKDDLKKLTAYSTVSQLGWIVCTIGIGTPLAMTAAIVHTLAHALFKSSLFMLIGVIDHHTGTRHIQRLGPIWRKMPITFTMATIAATSMAAVPPLFGFISKEGMLDAMLEGELATPATALLLTCAAIGAILTFAYSYRYIFGGFIDGTRDVSTVHEAPASLWIPAALPGFLSLPLGFIPGILDSFVDAAAHAALPTHHTEPTHLALVHGINLPLIISIIVIIGGVTCVVFRHAIARTIVGKELAPVTGAHALQGIVTRGSTWGKVSGSMADSVSPTRHLAMPFLAVITMAVAVAFGALLHNGTIDGVTMGPRVSGIDRPLDYVALATVIIGVAATVLAQRRLSAVIAVSVAGVGVTLQILTLGSPDVALTQILVELLTTVVLMLVIRLQPRDFTARSPRRDRWAAVIAILMGVTTTTGVIALVGYHGKPVLAQWYLINGPTVSHGNNVVNTILVEFRAFDTMGELSVLGMCGVAIAAVVLSVPRVRDDIRGSLAAIPRPELNSLPMRWMAKLLIPVLIMVSAAVFWRGHNHPGGGFIAALIGGGALMFYYLSRPNDTAPTTHRLPYILVGSGISLAFFAGLLGYLGHSSGEEGGHGSRGSFLQPLNGHIGSELVTTAQIFDAGVYLAVLGLVAIALLQLGGSIRPGAETPLGPPRADGGFSPVQAHESDYAPSTTGTNRESLTDSASDSGGDSSGRRPVDTVEVEE
ncbi:DUF4040 family protein [Corynebacterium kroppenstedtii]|uniref:DUF4040 family protein n=1 Tax=Corynebacterium sp. PCR 32 TaxID=3351342 RepID=UPI00309745F7